MKCGLLVFAAAALSSSPVLAQSVYVAPGGVYIASARVIVAPGGGAPYVAPDAPPAAYDGPGYGPGYAAPAPTAYVDPGYAAPAPAYYGNPGYPPPPVYGAPGYAAAAPGYASGLSAARLWRSRLPATRSRLQRSRLSADRAGLWPRLSAAARLRRTGLRGTRLWPAPRDTGELRPAGGLRRAQADARQRLCGGSSAAAAGGDTARRRRPLRRQSRQWAVGGLQLSGSHRTKGGSRNEPPDRGSSVADRPQRGVSPVFVFAGPAAGEARNSRSARAASGAAAFLLRPAEIAVTS